MSQAQIIQVLDSKSKDPIEFVSLVNENGITLSSNAKGVVNISPMEGSKIIQVRLIGYRIQSYSYDELKSHETLLLEVDAFDIDKVVVSASRWSQKKISLPNKIMQIEKKDIAFYNPQTSADLLGASGEVFIQKSQQGGGSPMIRGFSANRLLYAVDGVRMNTAIFRSGNLQNVIALDALAVNDVEIFFGPGSIIYGSDAIGGVMGFNTLKPKLSYGDSIVYSARTKNRYSSANQELTNHIDVNIGSKKWGVLASFTKSNFNDLRMGSNGPSEYQNTFYVDEIDGEDIVIPNKELNIQKRSDYEQSNYLINAIFTPTKKITLEYGFHQSNIKTSNRYDRLIQTNSGLPVYAINKYGPQNWNMHRFATNLKSTALLLDEAKFTLAYQKFEESRINRRFQDTSLIERNELVNAYSINLDLKKSMGKHQIFYGIEYILNDVESNANTTWINTNHRFESQSRYPESKWQSEAIYLKEQYKASDKWIFELGLRYNQFHLESEFDTTLFALPFDKASFNDDALTLSLGSVFKPNDNWVINANFSSGFRSPNVDDIGKIFDSEPGTVVVPNPGISEEVAYNFELGVTKIIADKIKVNAVGYYTLIDDALVRRNFNLMGQDSILYEGQLSQVQAIQNAANAYLYGFQFSFEYVINNTFRLRNHFNFQKGQEETDNGQKTNSRHAAPSFGRASLSYHKKQLKIQLYSTYQASLGYSELNIGERNKAHIYASDSQGRPHVPAWYTLNINSEYNLNNLFIFGFGIENITDQRYRPYSSGISASGINFIFSLNVNL